ncbi:MAG: NAD-dependent DNA ligase LigA, partial [Candidatus Pacebacteria bacterium]|nr:NAD-dependent DNA ligase LigA [Candidatus Paceibacterota bacterium]
IEKLFKNGVNIVYEEKKDTLKGLTFVLTGTLASIGREEAKESIRKLGGSIAPTPSPSTSYVVLGENPGSKYEKAKQLGLKILNEEEFYELINPS